MILVGCCDLLPLKTLVWVKLRDYVISRTNNYESLSTPRQRGARTVTLTERHFKSQGRTRVCSLRILVYLYEASSLKLLVHIVVLSY